MLLFGKLFAVNKELLILFSIGYLSDKIGRKFGMVNFFILVTFCLLTRNRPQMAATGIVALFSGLSAASSGAHGSLGGLLSMLSAMRYAFAIFS